jgi:integrase
LLTAQRRQKICALRWDDVQDGVWTIHTEAREKHNAGSLKLSQPALDILYKRRIHGQPYVFPSRDGGPWCTSSKLKQRLDNLSGTSGWVLHDLRRTAKTLMGRAGVAPHVSERVLGHKIGGVEGIYDRHAYDPEKAAALGTLAELIRQIINLPS